MSTSLLPFLVLTDITRDALIIHTMEVVEGAKYTDIKSDRGGKTRWGIIEDTCKAYQNLWPKYNFTGDMPSLPGPLAKDIYTLGYWDKLNLDAIYPINPALAAVLFDIGVNRGIGVAGKYLQRTLNVLNKRGKDYPDIAVDGGIGKGTIASLKAFVKKRGWEGARDIVYQILSLQNVSYIEIAERDATQEDFSNGWSDRVANSLEYLVPLMLASNYVPKGLD